MNKDVFDTTLKALAKQLWPRAEHWEEAEKTLLLLGDDAYDFLVKGVAPHLKKGDGKAIHRAIWGAAALWRDNRDDPKRRARLHRLLGRWMKWTEDWDADYISRCNKILDDVDRRYKQRKRAEARLAKLMKGGSEEAGEDKRVEASRKRTVDSPAVPCSTVKTGE
ncbi:MAG: hypothetical protein ABSA41_17030 [Terriglobia bacterium]|jgi:hypothetical protein